MNLKELSDSTKAIIYLGGLVVAAFLGGMISSRNISDIAALPDEVKELRTKINTMQSEFDAINNAGNAAAEAKIKRVYEVLELAEMPGGEGRSKLLEGLESRLGEVERRSNAPSINPDDLMQKWDEEEVFVTYNDLEYELARVGILEGEGNNDPNALPRLEVPDLSGFVMYGYPVRLQARSTNDSYLMVAGKVIPAGRNGGDDVDVVGVEAGNPTLWTIVRD